jgi:hypothetical protein
MLPDKKANKAMHPTAYSAELSWRLLRSALPAAGELGVLLRRAAWLQAAGANDVK